MLTDSFRGDLDYLRTKLLNKEPFSIARFGDGEMGIMQGKHLNLLHKREFKFEGEEDLRQDLIRSFTHDQDNYIVGVACRCCVGDSNHESMKKATGLPDDKLTIANIFVNSNYPYFKEFIVPTFKEYKVTFVSQGGVDKLPFRVDSHIKIGPNAWVDNFDVYDKLRLILAEGSSEHHLVLLCAGPYANILCQKLFKEFPSNTIIDLGSVFNIELGIGADRGYLRGSGTINKTCIW
jgi:hypothetical protein